MAGMVPNVTVNVNICCHLGHPAPPTNLSLVLVLDRSRNMATATANWTPSTSPDVTSQTLTFTVNGTAQAPQVFADNTTASAQLSVLPGDKVSVELFSTSPAGDSGHVSASGTVPSGGAGPAAPTNLSLSFTP